MKKNLLAFILFVVGCSSNNGGGGSPSTTPTRYAGYLVHTGEEHTNTPDPTKPVMKYDGAFYIEFDPEWLMMGGMKIGIQNPTCPTEALEYNLVPVSTGHFALPAPSISSSIQILPNGVFKRRETRMYRDGGDFEILENNFTEQSWTCENGKITIDGLEEGYLNQHSILIASEVWGGFYFGIKKSAAFTTATAMAGIDLNIFRWEVSGRQMWGWADTLPTRYPYNLHQGAYNTTLVSTASVGNGFSWTPVISDIGKPDTAHLVFDDSDDFFKLGVELYSVMPALRGNAANHKHILYGHRPDGTDFPVGYMLGTAGVINGKKFGIYVSPDGIADASGNSWAPRGLASLLIWEEK